MSFEGYLPLGISPSLIPFVCTRSLYVLTSGPTTRQLRMHLLHLIISTGRERVFMLLCGVRGVETWSVDVGADVV